MDYSKEEFLAKAADYAAETLSSLDETVQHYRSRATPFFIGGFFGGVFVGMLPMIIMIIIFLKNPKKKKKIKLPKSFFPLNQWNDVTIEIKEGAILITVNEQSKLIEDSLITLNTQQESQQIDFKGQDFGSVQLDWVKLYEGIGPEKENPSNSK